MRDMMVYRSEFDEELKDLEENLEGLTMGIPNMNIDEVPRHYHPILQVVLDDFIISFAEWPRPSHAIMSITRISLL